MYVSKIVTFSFQIHGIDFIEPHTMRIYKKQVKLYTNTTKLGRAVFIYQTHHIKTWTNSIWILLFLKFL